MNVNERGIETSEISENFGSRYAVSLSQQGSLGFRLVRGADCQIRPAFRGQMLPRYQIGEFGNPLRAYPVQKSIRLLMSLNTVDQDVSGG